MKLHESVWSDTETLFAIREDSGRARVGGINRFVAWVTEDTVVPPVLPTGMTIPAMQVACRAALETMPGPYLVGTARPAKGQILRFMRLCVNDAGLPLRVDHPDVEAASDLLVMLAKLHGRWPEVATAIEQARARMVLPPLGQDMA